MARIAGRAVVKAPPLSMRTLDTCRRRSNPRDGSRVLLLLLLLQHARTLLRLLRLGIRPRSTWFRPTRYIKAAQTHVLTIHSNPTKGKMLWWGSLSHTLS